MTKRKIKGILYACACVTFMGSVGAFAYPYVSDYINDIHTSRLYKQYIEEVRSLTSDDVNEMFRMAQSFNRALKSNDMRWLDGGVNELLYNSILDTSGTGIICYVEIPKISMRMPVYHGTNEATLQIGVGHMIGSSFPTGDKGTHAVLSGHNGLLHASIFTELDKMEEGDKFYISILGNKLEYIVDEINIVEPDDYNYFGIDGDNDYVTLMTCTPFGVNSHRLLIRGVRVDYSKESNRLEIRFDE